MNFPNVFGVIKDKVGSVINMDDPTVRATMPKVLLVAGIGLEIAAIASAVAASKKQEEILDDHEVQLAEAKMETTIDEEGNEIERSAEEINRDVRKCYGKTVWRFTKLYAPTVAFTSLSVGCFIGMHNIQAGEITSLTAAYTGLKEYIDRYEKRNIELNGEESHRMCKYGYKEETEENDTKKVASKTDDYSDSVFHDQFATYSKQTTPAFKGRKEYDLITLNCTQKYLNDLLKIRGWVVVNDALDYLELPRTDEGRVEGWVDGCGTSIDLGFMDPVNSDFIEGRRYDEILLAFNIHGNVNYLRNKQKEAAKLGKKVA